MHKTKVAMKRLFSLGAFLLALLAVGCSKYDDSALTGRVNDLEQRMKELETLCKETNTNISSLQTLVSAVQTGDYVKEVTPIMQDGKEVGCTISFGKGDPITIYHNSGGNTGESGTMPVIGVRQDEDGIYYWTLNDDWLLDDAGNKIKAQGTDGKSAYEQAVENGYTGTWEEWLEDVSQAIPVVVPKLKLEEGYWYVSYDGEQTWHQFGKATSDDSDLMFQEVKQDDHNIYFTLASGEKITVPKTSGLAISFKYNDLEIDSLLFSYSNTMQTIHYTITGGSKNNVVKAEMLNTDGSYTVRTTSTSATAGTIEIQTTIPTKNRVIVSVSDGRQTIMAAIDVSFLTIHVETPGTLSQLLTGYDQSKITVLAVTGSINDKDIATLASLPNLSVLDIENTDLKELPSAAFQGRMKLTSVKLPKTLTTIGDYALYYCTGLTGSLTIPNSVTEIGDQSFSGCSGLASLTIPNSVMEIGMAAFMNCSGLTNVMIPEGVTEIGQEAFSGCTSLTSLTLPSNMIRIATHAFSSCSSLIQIYCKSSTPPELGGAVFYNVPTSCALYVPTSCAEVYRTAEKWKNLTFKDIIETDF